MRRFSYLICLALVLALAGTNTAFGAVVWEGRVSSQNDDAEESVTNAGAIDLGSSDLEMPYENAGKGNNQIIGVRFVNVNVPKGTNITNAYVEFTCDETKDGTLAVSLLIDGEKTLNAAEFGGATNNISTRARTTAKVVWAPVNWTAVGQKDKTSNIATIIREIINQDSWASGNSLVLFLRDDPAKPSAGTRCADSFSDAATAALLHLEFTTKYASNPLPVDGTLYSDTWVSLGWDAGETAVSHDVYMSDNKDDVANGAAAAFRGNQAAALFLAGLGLPGDPYPTGLTPGATYYWRVDEVEANGTTKYQGPVWSFSIPPRTAYNPLPPDGAYFTDLATKLSWTAGFGAKLHYVYFGAKFEDVNNATTGGMPLGTTTFTPPGPLALNKTYYWRVDEFDGATKYKGNVWSFTTTIAGLGTAVMERWENINGTALSALKSDPRYPNTPTVTETVTRLAWDGPDTDNYGARIYGWLYIPATGNYTFWLNTDDNGELWLSTDDDPANASVIARETGYTGLNTWGTGEEQSQPIPLVAGERYYFAALWKEGGGGDHCQVAWQGPGVPTRTIIPGANISPYRPLSAYGAKPANGATSVSQNPILQWKPGVQAASHDVYFGTDPNAVKNATKTSLEYKGTRTRGSESYAPATLGWQTTYYWRVDEVNNVNPSSPWVGRVWSFTTADYGVVEDFESYNDIAAGKPGSNLVYATWLDGYGTTTNGSTIGYPSGASMETAKVHSGGLAVPLIYNNSTASFSEAERTFAAQNWTDHGIQTLSLWFYGNPTNVSGQLYVKINGVKVLYDGEAVNLRRAVWQTWNITLASAGVGLQSVTRLAVGVDNKGATGTLLLDDIRLYALPRQLITPVQPAATGLVARFAFEGNANDSAGGHNGTPNGGPTYAAGKFGQAISLDGVDDHVVVGSVGISSTTPRTISGWAKASTLTFPAWVDVFGFTGPSGTNGHFDIELVGDTANTTLGWYGLHVYGWERNIMLVDSEWHHLAATYDGTTIKWYGNGLLIGSEDRTISPPDNVHIGKRQDNTNYFPGMVDDVQIFSRVLSDAEIAGLAGIALPFDKPF